MSYLYMREHTKEMTGSELWGIEQSQSKSAHELYRSQDKLYRSHVKVRPGGGRSGKCRGMRDNRRRLEPGLERRCAEGAEYVARTGVQRPATLMKRMGRRSVAGSESNVVDSRKRSEIAFGELLRASLEWTPRDLATSGLGLSWWAVPLVLPSARDGERVARG
jgi:hypothetical protein